MSPAQTPVKPEPWYHHTSIYQVYPRSYFDSNGDGIGDIPGIIQKLDYIRDMGYDAIWFSPFYSSPQRDFGYDISDYENIAPEYGTLTDAEQLVNEVHQRGMKIIFDMVMNHTSDEHPWFKESSSSRTNPKADWYIWRDKPNGWKSVVGGSGWHYCAARNQYYWASFLPFQPDLNYRNPEVKKQMFDVVRFWLNKGVDGFRLDMFNSLYKDSAFRRTPAVRRSLARQGYSRKYLHTVKAIMNLPKSMAFAKDLRTLCDSFGDKLLLGEIYGKHDVVKRYLGTEKNDGLGLVFNFEMLRFHFRARYFHQLIASLEKDFPSPYMPVYVFSNHDRRRSMKRLDGNVAKAKLLHTLQLTVRGVPCMYYGEEIGMTDGRIPYKKALDPIAQKYKWVPRFLTDLADETLNRDEVRTPMQWDNTTQAGFSTDSNTWLPVNPDYKTVNVQSELADSHSLLHTVHQLLYLRQQYPALTSGSLKLLSGKEVPKGVLAYTRQKDGEEIRVYLNLTNKTKSIRIGEANYRMLFSLSTQDAIKDKSIHLASWGGVVLKTTK